VRFDDNFVLGELSFSFDLLSMACKNKGAFRNAQTVRRDASRSVSRSVVAKTFTGRV